MTKQTILAGALIVSLACLAGAAGADSANLATQILNDSGVRGGLVVHLGCGDGRLSAALSANESYVVHGLDTEAHNVENARRHVQSLGLYGRVTIDKFDGRRLPYAGNMVNLLVTEDLGAVGTDEVTRVLVPGGVAFLKSGNKRRKIAKPWPDEIDEWTHWLHGPDGNAVARDSAIGPIGSLQWMMSPLWMRHHDSGPSVTATVSAGGRVFIVHDVGPAGVDGRIPDTWFLEARDAFNGVLLWRRSMPNWGWNQWTVTWHSRNNIPFQLPKRLVAVGDRVYTTLEFNGPLVEIDAATGDLLKTYDGTEGTDEILLDDGLLILALNKTAHRPAAEERPPIKKSVAVVEADSGRMLWSTGDYVGLQAKSDSMEPLGRLELAAGDGRVFLADHDAVVGLDIETGRELWRTPRLVVPLAMANFNTRMTELCVLVYADDVVFFAQPEGGISFHSVPGTLRALSAVDGKLLWQRQYGGWVHNTQPNVFVIDGRVWIHEHLDVPLVGRGPSPEVQATMEYALLGLDLKSGNEERRFSTRDSLNVGHHHRCYRTKATERFLLTSRRGVECIDINSGENHLHHWTRGACQLGIMPANGLIYTTPHPCDCYIDTKLNGFYALGGVSSKGPGASEEGKKEARLERGPAYDPAAYSLQPTASSTSWPTFRADASRSGSIRTPISTDLSQRWTAKFDGRIGPATSAGGMVFVPVVDRHRVDALDASTGKTVWSFTADGRVDTPPTIHKGMALFGTAGGSVYCLDAADGRLAWRRRVAPQERLVGVEGGLESAWPVHGSVLVTEDLAYVAAGRSSYLDGGIHFYTLKPETGEIVAQHVVYSPDSETGKMPPGDEKTLPGMLADILVADGTTVWMRKNRVFGPETSDAPPILATGGFRDDSWFNRTSWSAGKTSHAQMLVFDDRTAYGVEAYTSMSRGGIFEAGEAGYRVFAQSLTAVSVEKKVTGRRKAKAPDVWSQRLPVRATAIAAADDVLLLAGAPDVVDPDDPGAAFDGRKGAVLCAVSTADGRKLAKQELPAPPVFDGLIAADGCLFISMADGTVICLGGEPKR